jgi:protoheme IX farnesyltransferase
VAERISHASTTLSPAAAPEVPEGDAPSLLADLWELTKPRIMLLLLITCACAMPWAADGVPRASVALAALLGLGLASGGASAINHVYDRDIDRLMNRTRNRPVAAGRVDPRIAVALGVVLNVAAGVVLWAFTTPLAALLCLGGSFFYAVVYTMILKRRTPQNIVIGGAAGAMPPLVGWAAVTGHLGWAPIVMFVVIFLWTPPHFWALAILARADYAKAGVPMLPVVRSERSTALQILLYTVLLVAFTILPTLTGLLGYLYLAAALALGAVFLWYAVRLLLTYSRDTARATFLYSIAYLALIFIAMGADRAIGGL